MAKQESKVTLEPMELTVKPDYKGYKEKLELRELPETMVLTEHKVYKVKKEILEIPVRLEQQEL